MFDLWMEGDYKFHTYHYMLRMEGVSFPVEGGGAQRAFLRENREKNRVIGPS